MVGLQAMTYAEMLLEIESEAIRTEEASNRATRKFYTMIKNFPEAERLGIIAYLRSKHPDFEILRRF